MAPSAKTEAWWFLDTLVIAHDVPSDGGPVVLEQLLPAGASPPRHYHHRLDDSWYLLEGQVVVECDGELRLVTSGSWVSVPRGVTHTFRVVGGESARTLLVHNDDNFLGLVRDLGVPTAARTLPEPTGGPGLEALQRALLEHDTTVVGDSLSAVDADRFLSHRAAELYGRAAAAFERVLREVGADHWGRPTPCGDWDVRALVQHMVAETRWVAPLLDGLTISDVGDRLDGDLLGPDPLAAWGNAIAEALAAITGCPDLATSVHLSYGDSPGVSYVTQLFAELLIHGWDLARSIGVDEVMDAELVEECSRWFAGVASDYRKAGVIAISVDGPPPVTAQDSLLTAFGRNPATALVEAASPSA
jgi:uncharacterized protein (TIGR03086 family)